jgi:hypothetical protein
LLGYGKASRAALFEAHTTAAVRLPRRCRRRYVLHTTCGGDGGGEDHIPALRSNATSAVTAAAARLCTLCLDELILV